VITEIRKNKEPSKAWLTVYSDIMTNLMLFFLVLYASTRMSGFAPGREADRVFDTFLTPAQQAERIEEEKAEKESMEELADLALDLEAKGIRLASDDAGVTVQLPAAGFFDSGRADLKPGFQVVLDLVAEPLKRYPKTIVIEGHTDDRPLLPGARFGSNWELSFARVQSVLRYLVREHGLPSERVVAIGRGPHQPLVPNDTPENRAKNRRIEIRLRAPEAAR